MTHPMPGPPEHCYCRDGNATCDDCETYGYRYSWGLCPGCELHNGRDLGAYKRLKDAECAAEYWMSRADWYANFGAFNWRQTFCWHRFATRPHALEES